MVRAHHSSQKYYVNSQSRVSEFLELEGIIITRKTLEPISPTAPNNTIFFSHKVPN